MSASDTADRSRKSRARKAKAGIKRKQILLERTTYKQLKGLVGKSGYNVDDKRELSHGITGVLLQLIGEAVRRIENGDLKFDKTKQQIVFLKRASKRLRSNSDDCDNELIQLWENYDEGRKRLKGAETEEKKIAIIDGVISRPKGNKSTGTKKVSQRKKMSPKKKVVTKKRVVARKNTPTRKKVFANKNVSPG